MRPHGRPLVLAAILLAVCGCCPTREALVELPPPPPTVITETDTLLVSVPDTLYRVVTLRDTVRVTETVAEVVTVYREPRPDSSRATRLHGLSLTPEALTLHGTRRDWRFRSPVAGERLVVASAAPDSLVARIEGEPTPPPPQRIECPEPEACLVSRTWRGYLLAISFGLACLVVGVVVGVVVRSFLPR